MATGRSKSRSKKRSKDAGRVRPLEDATVRGEIIGVGLSALALVLLIAVLAESSGIVGRTIGDALRGALGVGAYLIPLFILAWGVTFFLPRLAIDELSIGAGLGGAFLAVIAMVSLAAPEAGYWEAATATAHGGYVGGGLAWLLHTLFGTAISYVVLAALLIVSVIYATGISIAETFESARARLARGRSSGGSGGSAPEPYEAPAGDETRTLPIDDAPPAGDEPSACGEGSRSRRERKRVATPDPEAHRRTLPTTHVVAPRAQEGFSRPDRSMLERSDTTAGEKASKKDLQNTAEVIERTLGTFDIRSKVTGWTPGPTVTLFEVRIAQGIKVNRVTALSDDLALALAAPQVRILAPIPGKSLIGIEVPNSSRSIVTLGDVFAAAPKVGPGPLGLAIGKDVAGEAIVADLAGMPHLLIAGSTGTGKSVGINAMIMSILMNATPAEVRLILIDPKRIELNLYNGLPHLYVPVVTEAKEAASALYWAVGEMESRLKRLQKAGARNIAQYNALVQQDEAPDGAEEMSYLVIIIDELADLMMVAAKEVEDSICRIAQLARAAGIHLIVATQRPSTDIITGLIKTNITHRIAFAVGSGIDSRVILDQPGAEKLVGLGDMLFSTPAWSKPHRLQGAFVTEREISEVVSFVRDQAEPDYHEEILQLSVTSRGSDSLTDDEDDPLVWEAADIIVTSGIGSTSMLQRRLKVGYARAGRIMDMLEAKGVVGPPQGSKPRDVLADVEDLESIKAFEAADSEADLA